MNFLIIGIGNIGLRHIQGLAKVEKSNFYLYDKDRTYIDKFKNEFDIIEKSNTIFFLKSLKNISIRKKINLIIISTTTNGRVSILKKIREEFPKTKIVIEKPICQSMYELSQIIKINSNIFVNHPFRYVPWFKKIQNEFNKIYDGNKFEMCVNAPNLGIACNASHYIDLFNFFTKKNPTKVVSRKMIWKKSKRNGFFDVDGIVQIEFGKDHRVIINSITKLNEKRKIIITGKTSNGKFKINLLKNNCQFNNRKKITGKLLEQSKLSHLLYYQINNNNDKVTKLIDAANCYHPLLKELISSWNKRYKSNIKKIKIT